jgi:hypothetical protein
VRALLLLALAALLAGCTAEAPEFQGELPQPRLAGPSATVAAAGNESANATFDAPPVWQKGLWWRYRVRGTDTDYADTRVVTADQGGAYIMDTTSLQTAYIDALSDVSTLGPIRKADLAGSQNGTAVEFFRWPLVTNQTWTTSWDRTLQTITELAPRNAVVGGRLLQVVPFEARVGERVVSRYEYAPDAGWLGRVEFLGPDGQARFGLELEAWGRDFRGEAVRLSLAPLYHDAGTSLQAQGGFTVPGGAAYLDVRWRFEGDTLSWRLVFTDPANNAVTLSGNPCTANCSQPGNASLNATPGAWRVASATVVQGGAARAAYAQVDVVAVSVQRVPLA